MKAPNKKSVIKKQGAGSPRQQVRIIGGQWKRSSLPVADVDGLRPTPDRVRETVFNWLGHLIEGAWPQVVCLDVFAGTGALGFEAASRGAAHTTFIESNAAALRQLRAAKEKLHAEQVAILQGDAFATLQRMASQRQQFDIIFLDPPYSQDWLPRVMPMCAPILKENGLIYAESAYPLDEKDVSEPTWLKEWQIIRSDRAGAVFYYLLTVAK